MIELHPEYDACHEVSAVCTACFAAVITRRIDFSRACVALTIGGHPPVPDSPATLTASAPEEPAGVVDGNEGPSVVSVIAIA
jgi:hypothetical protein